MSCCKKPAESTAPSMRVTASTSCACSRTTIDCSWWGVVTSQGTKPGDHRLIELLSSWHYSNNFQLTGNSTCAGMSSYKFSNALVVLDAILIFPQERISTNLGEKRRTRNTIQTACRKTNKQCSTINRAPLWQIRIQCRFKCRTQAYHVVSK